jgi:hypothetical protein
MMLSRGLLMKQYARFVCKGIASHGRLLVYLSLLCISAEAQDVPILRQNMWEAGGFVGATYGADKARVMGGGNLTYSALRNLLPYVEVSYFPGIVRTLVKPDDLGTIKYDIPLTDVNFGIHARFQLPKTPIVPYAVLGIGVLHMPAGTETLLTPNDSGGFETGLKSVSSYTGYAPNFGGGIRLYLKEQFGVRGEFKAYQFAGGPLKDQLKLNRVWSATFGMFIQLGK